MYKALIWKEYRETRLPLAMTVLSCIILSWIIYITNENVSDSYVRFNVLEQSFFTAIVLLISFYAVMSGAEAFASEHQSNTFDFLVSRAVSRKVLWQCKFVFRISTLLLPIVIFLFINRYTISAQVNFLFQQQCSFALCTLLIFSASFFFSTIFNRPIKAGATGLIVFVAYAGLFDRLSDSFGAFIISCVILTTLILAASFFIFTRNKLSRAV